MGIETLHESIIYYPCDECEEELMITLQIWEYPVGFANIYNIEVDDDSCELIKRCDIRELLDL